jgi:hypothetical protein
LRLSHFRRSRSSTPLLPLFYCSSVRSCPVLIQLVAVDPVHRPPPSIQLVSA